MKGIFPIDKFRELRTPFYYYDTKVLRDTLTAINKEVARYQHFDVHYAVKANANPKVLTIIRESGLGADCVSGEYSFHKRYFVLGLPQRGQRAQSLNFF